MKKRWLLCISALALAAVAAVARIGPPGGTVYVDGVAYEAVGTPRDVPNRGPFGTLYQLGEGLAPVASSAPGDRDYRGGRWELREITWDSLSPRQLESEEQLFRWSDEGYLIVGEVVRHIEYPLIRR